MTVAWTRDDLVLLEWAEVNRPKVAALQEALEDLWSCIGTIEIRHLQPETVALAMANHDLLCHEQEAS